MKWYGLCRKVFAVALPLLNVSHLRAEPFGTGFIYQGQLAVGTNPAGGSYDLRFGLYEVSSGGAAIGPVLTNSALIGSDGLFTAVLDFGAGAFNGEARWLELGVRTNGSAAFTTLSPRQPVMPTPYALHAASAEQVAAGNLTGTLNPNQLPASINLSTAVVANATIGSATVGSATFGDFTAGTISGDGARLRNMPVPPYALARFAPTPPLIYSPWYDFYYTIGTNQTDAFLRQVAQQMATNGLLAAGWNFIWIDDGWANASRDARDNLVANPQNFPNGISNLVTYLHGLGFKVGIYSSFGEGTCLHVAGSDEAHLPQDVQLMASWGIDGFKLDSCFEPVWPEDAYSYDRRMLNTAANAILDSHRDMVLMAVPQTDDPVNLYPGRPIAWQAQYEANMFVVWGTSEGVSDVNMAVLNAAYTARCCSSMIGPGHYAVEGAFDLRGMSLPALQAGMTMAAMVSVPMVVNSYWPGPVVELLTNAEVLAIHQDAAAICGTQAWSNNLAQVWTKPLGGRGSGASAIALVNLASTNQTLAVSWNLLGVASDEPLTIRDVWARNTLGIYTGSWTNTVPPNSVQLFKATAPTGLTTNVTVLRPGGSTNTLVFRKGVLVDVQP
jgi:alpha-galactosidase